MTSIATGIRPPGQSQHVDPLAFEIDYLRRVARDIESQFPESVRGGLKVKVSQDPFAVRLFVTVQGTSVTHQFSALGGDGARVMVPDWILGSICATNA